MVKEHYFLAEHSGQESAVSPCSGSQSQCMIRFILPTHGASHIIALPGDLHVDGNN